MKERAAARRAQAVFFRKILCFRELFSGDTLTLGNKIRLAMQTLTHTPATSSGD
jgi:hypothetical protein